MALCLSFEGIEVEAFVKLKTATDSVTDTMTLTAAVPVTTELTFHSNETSGPETSVKTMRQNQNAIPVCVNGARIISKYRCKQVFVLMVR